MLAATEDFHIHPAVGTANHRQDGRDQDGVQRRLSGPFHAGIFDVVEEVHQGNGGTGGHEGELRGEGDNPGYTPSPSSPIRMRLPCHQTWFRLWLPLGASVPTDDTYRLLVRRLEPETAMQAALLLRDGS